MSEREKELTIIEPENIKTVEGESKGDMVLIIDKNSGKITFRGNPREAREWLNGERSRENLGGPRIKIESVKKGGLAIPGMVDTHEHIFHYTSLEDAIDINQARNLQEISKIIKRMINQKRGRPIILYNWKTETIPNLSREFLDEISKDQPIIVIDPSFHGAVVNEKMAQLITNSIRSEEAIAGDFNIKTGRVTEGYLMKAYDFMSPEAEIVEERVEKTLEKYFAQGITGVHDMGLSSWSQFLAFLNLRKGWEQKKGYSFPVIKAFLFPHVFERFIKTKNELEKSGLWKDELLPTLGLKLLADGSFGSRTARLSENYIDANTKGTWATKIEEMNRLIKLAHRQGIDNVAIHAIGDTGISRAVQLAQRMQIEAKRMNREIDLSRYRIEHLELPLPQETLRSIKNLGLWTSMQPNFLTDYIYQDRLGDRIRWICPHRTVLNYEIPMMFGTDGMPMETLFGIWAATHAVEERQRLNFEEAMFAFSVMPGRYLGERTGQLSVGQKADIAVVDPSDFERIIGGETPQTFKEFGVLGKEVQSTLKKFSTLSTFIEGKQVR